MTSEDQANKRYIIGVVSLSLLIISAATLFLWLIEKQEAYAASFLSGSLLSIFNFILLAYVLKSFLSQKSVAWAVTLIVSKYPILGFIIYILATRIWFDVFYFCIGFGGVLIIALLLLLFKRIGLTKASNGSL